ncbi:MAG: PQQ-binding-like beta-propeller repeat protein [Halioglobus sp.]
MRISLLLIFLSTLIACSDSSDSSDFSTPQEDSLLPFQSYQASEQPRGGQCDEDIDLAAPLINTGLGYDLENTRHAESIVDSTNVTELALNFSYASDGASEMRGAATVTAQAIFFAGGDTVTAINRNSGCRYWSYRTELAGGVFRSASVLLHTPEQDDALVYVGDYRGNVHALNASDGSLRWLEFAGSNSTHHFITGGMQAQGKTLIVPVSSKEVFTGAFNPGGCCVSHGVLTALNASTGERLWDYHTTEEATQVIQPLERMGPNGAPIWSTPTIDIERGAIYIGTGQNYTEPTTGTSDAIISLDIETGSVNWIFQATEGDAWNYACALMRPLRCPDPEGHDFDFGAAPVLANEGSSLIAADKGGMIYALNPDNGNLNWSRKLSIGSWLGGIHWGLAVDDQRIYAAATDFEIDPASGNLEDLVPGANPGIYALELATGDLIWEIHPERLYEGLQTPLLFSAAVSVTNDVLFAGSLIGTMKAYATDDGRELWSYDASQDLEDINGLPGEGGTIDGAGFVVAGDGLVINSGYTVIFGGVGRYQAGAGNTLFVLRLGGAP